MKARELLDRNWRLVELISLDLQRHNTLNQCELRMITKSYQDDDSDFLALLDIYRAHRREVPAAEDFMQMFPGTPWYETLLELWARIGGHGETLQELYVRRTRLRELARRG